jgi:hypothetical protein
MMKNEENKTASLLEYLSSCTKEQAREAIMNLPKHQQIQLVRDICSSVNVLVTSITQNADKIWHDAQQEKTRHH